MPKVSIIMPVYNSELYLSSSLDSVLKQTFSDIEIVCVDDGSVDNSGLILKNYQKQDNRVKVITQKNGGGSVARNVGINNSIGEYIMFLDSDDIYAKDIVASAYNRSIETGADIVYYNFARFIGRPTKMAIVNKTTPKDELRLFTKDSYTNRFFNDFAIITWNKIIKKSIIIDNDLSFNKKLSHNHDVDFSVRLMLAAKSYSWLNKVGYFYRENNAGLTATKRNDPTNVLKILVDLNKLIASKHEPLKPSFDNYVADMIAGTTLKYSNNPNELIEVFNFSHDVVIPEVCLASRVDVFEPTGIFDIVEAGDYRVLVNYINNPKQKVKRYIRYLYNIAQGILARSTV